jgi:hypothetical protein
MPAQPIWDASWELGEVEQYLDALLLQIDLRAEPVSQNGGFARRIRFNHEDSKDASTRMTKLD